MFKISAPQSLQLSGIQAKYRKILADIIAMDITDLTVIPLKDYYRIGITTVGHRFSDADIEDIEKVRPFQMLCKQKVGIPATEIGLLTPDITPIFVTLYSRVIQFSNAEINRVEKLNMILNLSIKKLEVSVEADTTLQLSRIDKRNNYLMFEHPQVSLVRRRQRDEDKEMELADKQAQAVGLAVGDALARVFEAVVKKEDEKQLERSRLQNSAPISARRASTSDSDSGSQRRQYGAVPKTVLQPKIAQPLSQRAPQMDSQLPFNLNFPPPPPMTSYLQSPPGHHPPGFLPPGNLHILHSHNPISQIKIPAVKTERRVHNEEEMQALSLTRKHCTSGSRSDTDQKNSDSDDEKIPSAEAKAKLLWIVKNLEDDPSFKLVNIKQLMKNTKLK